MADRGKGNGRETPRGNRRPAPYLTRGVIPISRAVSPLLNHEAYTYAQQIGVNHGAPLPDGVFTPQQINGLAPAVVLPPPPPPPLIGYCPYCGQHAWQPVPQGGGGECLNPVCEAVQDDNAGTTYPGKIVVEQERQAEEERQRCSKGSCNVMGGKKKKKRKTKKRKTRRR